MSDIIYTNEDEDVVLHPESNQSEVPENSSDDQANDQVNNQDNLETSGDLSTEDTPITAEDIANMSEEEIDNLTLEELNSRNSNLSEEQVQDAINNAADNSGNISNENNQVQQGQQAQQVQQEQLEELKASTGMSDADFRSFLTSSFRANNRDVQVDNPEDIRKLMQLGMNYQKKIGQIKPHLRVVKSLEQAGLLEDDKINELIDLAQNKPEAIASLLKKGDINTYDLPDIEETPYQPENHIMSEEQYVLDEIITDLSERESGKQVLGSITSWDDNSKSELYENPQLLNELADQVESGLYQDTMAIIERDRALGKVPEDLSTIEAYNIVATQLLNQESSTYNKPSHWQNQNPYAQQPNQGSNYSAQNAPNPQLEQNRVVGNNIQQGSANQGISQKQSAGIPQQRANNTPVSLVDPVAIANLSDEDMDKFGSFEQYVQSVRFK